MTREEAIRHLKFLRDKLNRWTGLNDKDKETFTMAISALEGANGDTISRQAAIDAVKEHRSIFCDSTPETFSVLPYGEKCRVDEIDNAIATLVNLPSAQPERKTGRWILHENQRQEDVDNGNYLYICSECGKSDIHAKTQEVPFCWWCGAKMEVEHD